MMLTKKMLTDELEQIKEIIGKTYGTDCPEYENMTFALNLYYGSIIKYLEK